MAERFKTEKRSLRLFVTGSTARDDTITTSSYQEASSSFAENIYITDTWDEIDPVTKKSATRALMYAMQRIQEDVEDLYSEVSQSLYVNQVNSGSIVHDVKTFAAGDDTPDVSGGTIFKTANDSRNVGLITQFDGGVEGQQITILISDAFTDFIYHASNLILSKAGNWTAAASGDSITFVHNGTCFVEINRSDNT
jgi:hypothetical protein